MIELYRGTTPELAITLPEDLNLSTVQSCWIFFYQQGRLTLEKERPFTVEGQTILFDLEQEDTMKLLPGKGKFQMRLLLANEEAYITDELDCQIGDTKKGGKIT